MFDELIKQIERLLTEKSHITVGITGYAGSGKSTLASRLAEYFGVNDSQILRLDNLYLPRPRDRGLFDDYDWHLVTRILQDVHAGKRLQYRSRGFEEDSFMFDEPLPKVVILEGIRLFRPEMMQHFDVSVWVDCPPELALQRAKDRDLKQGHDEEYMKRWDTEWGPQNEEYYNVYHPEKLANFIYRDYK